MNLQKTRTTKRRFAVRDKAYFLIHKKVLGKQFYDHHCKIFIMKPRQMHMNNVSVFRGFLHLNKRPSKEGLFCAGGNGFEPLLADPESAVLPLDEPPIDFQRAVLYHAGCLWARPICCAQRGGYYLRYPSRSKAPAPWLEEIQRRSNPPNWAESATKATAKNQSVR